MNLRNIFTRKANSAKVEIPKEIQDQILEEVLRKLNAKPKACPYQPFSMSTQVQFCDRPLLEGSKYCLWHTPNTAKYDPKVMERYFGDSRTLKEAVEKEASADLSLLGVYLVDAEIRGDMFRKGINVPGARFDFGNLTGARLSCACLKGASFVGTKLENAYLSDADIRDANFLHANLHNAKFRQNDFAGVRGLKKESFGPWRLGLFPDCRILEDYPDQSVEVYRSLVAYFTARGALDDASWAAYRGRVVQRELLKRSLSLYSPIAHRLFLGPYTLGETTDVRALKKFAVMRCASTLLAVLLSYIACYTFGYGEKPLRVVLVAWLAITLYAVLFIWLQAISTPGFWNALYFSIVTFTTLGYGDIAPKAQFRLLAASEALVGVVLVGLFLFTLSRRAVGRG